MNEQLQYSEAVSQAKKSLLSMASHRKERKSLNHSVHEWYIGDLCNIKMVTHLLN